MLGLVLIIVLAALCGLAVKRVMDHDTSALSDDDLDEDGEKIEWQATEQTESQS